MATIEEVQEKYPRASVTKESYFMSEMKMHYYSVVLPGMSGAPVYIDFEEFHFDNATLNQVSWLIDHKLRAEARV